jgi:hypothetical protein
MTPEPERKFTPYHNPIHNPPEPHWTLKVLAWVIVLSAFAALGAVFYKVVEALRP